jgi:acyl-CoA synthetase (NDP forming)
VDAIVACFAVLVGDDVTRIATALGELRERTSMPVVAARTGASSLAPEAAALLAQARVPAYSTPERAVHALAALAVTATRATESDREHGPVAGLPGMGASEDELKALLGAVGLPIPGSVLATSLEQARAGVAKVGGVAVCKAVVPGLLHKSDAGGVILGVTEASVDDAWLRLVALGGDVLVERFVPGGVEVLVGITPSSLGRVLTVGVGGVLTEVIGDVAVRVLPVSETDVRDMIAQTRLAMLLAGVRGSEPADIDALVLAVLGLVDATRDWPDGFELDLNPITVLTEGCWILDAAYSQSHADIPDGGHH